MIAPPAHIVHRFGLELDFEEQAGASHQAEELMATCRAVVATIIDDCCQGIVGADEWITIPQLEINLGTLDLRDLSADFLQRFRHGLQRQLQGAILQQERPTPVARATALVQHYGDTGHYPWWANANTPDLLAQAITTLLDARETLPPAFWRQLLGNGQVLRRLLLALPASQILEMWEVVSGNGAPQLASATLEAATRAMLAVSQPRDRMRWRTFAYESLQRRLQMGAVAIHPQALGIWLLTEGNLHLSPAILQRFDRVDAWVALVAWLRDMLAIPAELLAALILYQAADPRGVNDKAAANAVQAWLTTIWSIDPSAAQSLIAGLATNYRLGISSIADRSHKTIGESQTQGFAKTTAQNGADHASAANTEALSVDEIRQILWEFKQAYPSNALTMALLEDWLSTQFPAWTSEMRSAQAAAIWRLLQLAPERIPSPKQPLVQEKEAHIAAVQEATEAYWAMQNQSPATLEAILVWLRAYRPAIPAAERKDFGRAMLEWVAQRQVQNASTAPKKETFAARLVQSILGHGRDPLPILREAIRKGIDSQTEIQALYEQWRADAPTATFTSHAILQWIKSQQLTEASEEEMNALAVEMLQFAGHSSRATLRGESPWEGETPSTLLAKFQEMHPQAMADRDVLLAWIMRHLHISVHAQHHLADAMRTLAAQQAAATSTAAQDPWIAPTAQRPRHHAHQEAPLWVDNAGLVLFWPFLQRLFQQLDLVEGKEFKSMQAQEQALRLLQAMVTGGEEGNEAALALPKILCGLPPDAIVDPMVALAPEMEEARDLLIEVALQHWTMAGQMSVEGFRHAWLQRNASLRIRDDHWLLRVEGMGHDVLLDGLPWEIAYIQLPWMPHVMYVDWGDKAKFNA